MKSIVKLSVKKTRVPLAEELAPYDGSPISSSKDVARIAKALIGDEAQEVMLVFVLNAKNKLLGYSEVSRGTTTSASISVDVLLRPVLLVGGVGIVVAHNHPSGSSEPSNEDVVMTERIKEASKLLGIQLLDHVVVSDEGWFSFLDAGLLVSKI